MTVQGAYDTINQNKQDSNLQEDAMIKLKDMKEDIMEILPFTELLNASEKTC